MIRKKWFPTPVDEIVDSLVFKSKLVLKKNIAYNIQYLQFLSKNIKEEKTTSVLYKMRFKNYLVVAMSIIESIFIALLDERDLIPLEEWKEGTHHKNQIDDNTIEVSFKRKRIAPKKKRIKLDEALSLMKKNNFLNLEEKHFVFLDLFKDSRNYIHLDKAESSFDSDYNRNGVLDYKMINVILFVILNNNKVSCKYDYTNFMKQVSIMDAF